MAGIESDADRLAFFDTDEFADTIAVRPVTGTPFAPYTVTGNFDARPGEGRLARRFGASGSVSGSKPQFRCRASDMPKARAGQAIATILGRDYAVYDVEHDGTGMARVELTLA